MSWVCRTLFQSPPGWHILSEYQSGCGYRFVRRRGRWHLKPFVQWWYHRSVQEDFYIRHSFRSHDSWFLRNNSKEFFGGKCPILHIAACGLAFPGWFPADCFQLQISTAGQYRQKSKKVMFHWEVRRGRHVRFPGKNSQCFWAGCNGLPTWH